MVVSVTGDIPLEDRGWAHLVPRRVFRGPCTDRGPCTERNLAGRSRNGRRSWAGGLEPSDELCIRRLLDDPVELSSVIRNEADAVDRNVVDRPTRTMLNHSILERNLASVATPNRGRDGSPVAVDGLAEIADGQAAMHVGP